MRSFILPILAGHVQAKGFLALVHRRGYGRNGVHRSRIQRPGLGRRIPTGQQPHGCLFIPLASESDSVPCLEQYQDATVDDGEEAFDGEEEVSFDGRSFPPSPS